MGCGLVANIPLDCRNAMGGLREMKIKVLPSPTVLTNDYTLTSGVIAIGNGSSSQLGWYTYGLEKEISDFTEVVTVNHANGTVFSKQDIDLIINQLTATKRNEIDNLKQNRLQVAVWTKDNSFWLFGYENGLDLVTSTATSGKGSGDRNGYNLKFAGMEYYQMPNMTQATYLTLHASN